MPKLDDDDDDEDWNLKLAKQISLEEAGCTDTTESESTEHDYCVICFDKKLLKSFNPCCHKSICKNCVLSYTSDLCPICRRPYDTII